MLKRLLFYVFIFLDLTFNLLLIRYNNEYIVLMKHIFSLIGIVMLIWFTKYHLVDNNNYNNNRDKIC